MTDGSIIKVYEFGILFKDLESDLFSSTSSTKHMTGKLTWQKLILLFFMLFLSFTFGHHKAFTVICLVC